MTNTIALQKKKLNLTVIKIFHNLTWSFWKRCLSIASALKFKTTDKKHKHIQKDISRKTNVFQKRLTRGFFGKTESRRLQRCCSSAGRTDKEEFLS